MRKSSHPLYPIYNAMRARCTSSNDPRWHRYGGRGIEVCQRWLDDFWTFVEDMGERPEGLTLERKDNDKGYSPENCVWTTQKAQSENKSIPKGKGVFKTRWNTWIAQIYDKGKKYYLGSYDCPLMARMAYLDKKSELHPL